MNNLIDFGVCELVGCKKKYIYIITFKRYFNYIMCVQIRCNIVRSQLLGERPKGITVLPNNKVGQEGLKLY